jgi:hypothetical protein
VLSILEFKRTIDYNFKGGPLKSIAGVIRGQQTAGRVDVRECFNINFDVD